MPLVSTPLKLRACCAISYAFGQRDQTNQQITSWGLKREGTWNALETCSRSITTCSPENVFLPFRTIPTETQHLVRHRLVPICFSTTNKPLQWYQSTHFCLSSRTH